MKTVTAVLGAIDTEMDETEAILRSRSIRVEYATRNGVRVKNTQAYIADPPVTGPDCDEVWFVECGGTALNRWAGTTPVRVLDHHRETDPGYERDYKRYFEGSSIGQVIMALYERTYELENNTSMTINREGRLYIMQRYGESLKDAPVYPVPLNHRIIAACDHCLLHAWAGRCYGVTAQQVCEHRLEKEVRRKRTSLEVVESNFDLVHNKIKTLPKIRVCGIEAVDTTFLGSVLDDGVIKHICTLSEAVREGNRDVWHPQVPLISDVFSFMGVPFYSVDYTSSGSKKVLFGNCAEPEHVQRVKDNMRDTGFRHVYGVPKRGYCGGIK
jgi:hypothetical protein